MCERCDEAMALVAGAAEACITMLKEGRFKAQCHMKDHQGEEHCWFLETQEFDFEKTTVAEFDAGMRRDAKDLELNARMMGGRELIVAFIASAALMEGDLKEAEALVQEKIRDDRVQDLDLKKVLIVNWQCVDNPGFAAVCPLRDIERTEDGIKAEAIIGLIGNANPNLVGPFCALLTKTAGQWN